MTSARRAAVDVVERVADSGAYSNVLVPATDVTPSSDHRFFERLVYTTLRWLPGIDRSLAAVSNRPIDDLDGRVRAILRVAAAEYGYLDGTPHAVVNEYVEVAKYGTSRRASGFVNAVLRSLVERPRPDRELAEAYPRWLIDAVRADLDTEPGNAFLDASNGPAPIGIRQRPATESTYLEPSDERPKPGASTDVIDPASAAVAVAATVDRGMAVLDLAAAPAGKTRALADAAGPSGLVVAADVHERRLRSAKARPHTPRTVRWVVADGRASPFAPESFDRVVLDAPCSGLGTMRRRPEIRHRVDPATIEDLAALQRSLLEGALVLARPGGRVVYSVCTIFRRETIDVVDGLGFQPPEGIVGQPFGDGLLLGPHIGGTDGMFIAVRDG